MSNLTKGLGVAVTALACWVAPCATAAQRTEAPAPPSWTPALPGERQPGAAERSRPADAPPADQGEGPSPRSARPAPDTPGETAPRKPQPARSRNTLRAAANGLGNTIVIDNGTGRSRTVIENTRNGVGNRVVIVDGEVVTDRPAPGRAGGNGLEF